MDVLICRLQPWQAIRVAKTLQKAGHSVHSIDHGQIDQYHSEDAFKSCHLWRPLDRPFKDLVNQMVGIIRAHNIGLVIIAQKLFTYSNAAEVACRTLGVPCVFTEFFFDDKLIFDDIGLQYTKETMKNGTSDLPISWPKTDREEQPADKTADELCTSLGIVPENTVVVYGQVLWDMSLVESPENMPYDEYIDSLCRENPTTTFLFKPHPKDHYAEPNSSKYDYPNLKRVNESLRTLFQLPYHTAYSSTVIFEGILRGVKFASVGYHFFDRHPYRIKRGGFRNIIQKIASVQYDQRQVEREASYLTNFYAISMDDPRLPERLLCKGDLYTQMMSARAGENG
jgi:hypothetical protein